MKLNNGEDSNGDPKAEHMLMSKIWIQRKLEGKKS